MRSKFSFEVMDLDDGLVAVPVGEGAEIFRGVLKVNETAAAIIKLLENETTEDAIVDALLKEYAGDREQIAGYVHEYIEKLTTEGIIE